MRRLWVTLALAVACTPVLSAVPLGGKEWVAPERHTDRRTHTAGPTLPQARSQGTEVAAKRPSLAAPAGVRQGGPVRFAFQPLAAGSVVTLDSRFTVRASVRTSLKGVQSSQDAVFEVERRLEARVLTSRNDGIRTLDVEVKQSKSSFKMSDMDDDEESESDKRYRILFQGGIPQVTSPSGTLDPDEVQQVLFDLATITGYLPLVQPALPQTLSAGWSKRFEASEVQPLFGSFSPVRLEKGSLSFLGMDPQNSDQARFECAVAVRLERDGVTLGGDLSGSCSVNPSTTRPRAIHLRGKIRGLNTLTLGEDASIAGTAELRLNHVYRP